MCWRQLADLQLIPDKCNKELSELTSQLDALNNDKQKEEEHLHEVMDSFKSETEVCVTQLISDGQLQAGLPTLRNQK